MSCASRIADSLISKSYNFPSLHARSTAAQIDRRPKNLKLSRKKVQDGRQAFQQKLLQKLAKAKYSRQTAAVLKIKDKTVTKLN
jgi:hypothetical protein